MALPFEWDMFYIRPNKWKWRKKKLIDRVPYYSYFTRSLFTFVMPIIYRIYFRLLVFCLFSPLVIFKSSGGFLVAINAHRRTRKYMLSHVFAWLKTILMSRRGPCKAHIELWRKMSHISLWALHEPIVCMMKKDCFW